MTNSCISCLVVCSYRHVCDCCVNTLENYDIFQTDAKFQRYNKHARALKLIPISAENSGGIDYELKSAVGNCMGTEFASTIKVCIVNVLKFSTFYN